MGVKSFGSSYFVCVRLVGWSMFAVGAVGGCVVKEMVWKCGWGGVGGMILHVVTCGSPGELCALKYFKNIF